MNANDDRDSGNDADRAEMAADRAESAAAAAAEIATSLGDVAAGPAVLDAYGVDAAGEAGVADAANVGTGAVGEGPGPYDVDG